MKQLKFRLPGPAQLPGKLIVDLFCGAGGASQGIELALGRSPDLCVNHSPLAIANHQANHPTSRHALENVWKVNPREAVGGRPVGLLWASPDCTHFSRAKGGKPVKRRIRSLANVVVKWARDVQPDVICLENVAEFQDWGPLGPDNKPVKAKAGQYFRKWKRSLEGQGYEVQHQVLNAADFGAPTSRRRLFLVARRDGKPITWPEPSHGKGRAKPWRTAAECIDWDLACPSIFERDRPLAEATLRRIARGIDRYVLKDPRPFIVKVNHKYDVFRGQKADVPLQTVTGQNGFALVAPSIMTNNTGHPGQKLDKALNTVTSTQHHALVAASIARIGQKGGNGKYCNSALEPVTTITTKGEHLLVGASLAHIGNGEREGQAPRAMDIKAPLGTVVAGGTKHALCAAILKHYGGVTGQRADKPAGTITTQDHHALLAAHVTKFYNTCTGAPADGPLPTITAGGEKGGNSHLGLVAAFLAKYNGTAVGQKAGAPLDTITGTDRFGVVTVTLEGQEYALVDIGMRMLQPHELAKAQGFPDEYVLMGTKAERVKMIGNSVVPALAEAVVRANLVRGPARAEKVA